MAITALPYGVFLLDLGKAVHNFGSDTDNVALLTSSYVPDYQAHTSFADVKANEVVGGGYTAYGKTLTGLSLSGTSNAATLNASPAAWTSLSVTTRYAVLYKKASTDAASKLIGLLDFGQDRVYDAEPFQLSFPSGLLTITAV